VQGPGHIGMRKKIFEKISVALKISFCYFEILGKKI
jgi:hypothetical protein